MSGIAIIKNKADWDALLAGAGGKPVVIDFHAQWCGPCKMIAPMFDKLSQQPGNAQFVFARCDVDEAEDVAKITNISAMPTFQVWKDGAMVSSLVGANMGRLQVMLQDNGGVNLENQQKQ